MEQKKHWWRRWSAFLSWLLSGCIGTVFWKLERYIGLAGVPDDVEAVRSEIDSMISAIPTPLYWSVFGASLMAALIFNAIYVTENWVSRAKVAIRKAAGQAGKLVPRIKIGGAEYIPFNNLIDVVGAIDMEPLGDDGVRVGTLPAGANLVCLPSGHVRLALPVRISATLRSGSPRIEVTLAGCAAVPTLAKAAGNE